MERKKVTKNGRQDFYDEPVVYGSTTFIYDGHGDILASYRCAFYSDALFEMEDRFNEVYEIRDISDNLCDSADCGCVSRSKRSVFK